MTDDMQAFIDTVETWAVLRKEVRDFARPDMYRFVERMNANTRKLISHTGKQDPDFWSSLMELSQNACTMTTPGAKIFADGQDRTNL